MKIWATSIGPIKIRWGNGFATGRSHRGKTIVGVVAPVRHSQVAGDESSAEGRDRCGKKVFYYYPALSGRIGGHIF